MATSSPAPESQAALSPLSRVVGVFFSPASTFRDIVRKPTWLLPMIVLIITSIVVCVGINQRMDWRQFIAHQMEKNPRAADLPEDQKQRQIEMGAKFAPFGVYLFGIFTPLAVAAIVALLMMAAYNLLAGVKANYVTSLSIVAHSWLTSIVSSIIFLMVLFLRPPGTVDLENPVASNLAVVLPEGSAKWLVALLKSIDVFSIWALILLAIGFAAVNPKKLKGAKSFSIVFSVWAVFVVLRVAVAFIFS
ncbi:MAG: hypothetical protein NVS9B4_21390 [Candidatus Acidiferrum sp.]